MEDDSSFTLRFGQMFLIEKLLKMFKIKRIKCFLRDILFRVFNQSIRVKEIKNSNKYSGKLCPLSSEVGGGQKKGQVIKLWSSPRSCTIHKGKFFLYS